MSSYTDKKSNDVAFAKGKVARFFSIGQTRIILYFVSGSEFLTDHH